MSRILRRPMFRGGPVSSYGTGIATGLGYEDGGRVGYSKAGKVKTLEETLKYERRKQDSKRQIRIVDPQYLDLFLQEFNSLIRK